jgi:hypothetical protein
MEIANVARVFSSPRSSRVASLPVTAAATHADQTDNQREHNQAPGLQKHIRPPIGTRAYPKHDGGATPRECGRLGPSKQAIPNEESKSESPAGRKPLPETGSRFRLD